MFFATKIKMVKGKEKSNNLLEIDEIFVDGFGWQKKAFYYDYLSSHLGSILVNIKPFPPLIKQLSVNNEKYVKSKPNKFGFDNLLDLPRE